MGIRLLSAKIFLIGFMGSGKSSVGRALAQDLGSYFLDTDALIETDVGASVLEIFAHQGEAYFRDKERETAAWIERACSEAVIATGGGLPLAVPNLGHNGRVIFLDLSFEAVLSRMNEEERSKRPLFADPLKAEALFDARHKVYQRLAHHTVNVNQPIDKIIKEIKEFL